MRRSDLRPKARPDAPNRQNGAAPQIVEGREFERGIVPGGAHSTVQIELSSHVRIERGISTPGRHDSRLKATHPTQRRRERWIEDLPPQSEPWVGFGMEQQLPRGERVPLEKR